MLRQKAGPGAGDEQEQLLSEIELCRPDLGMAVEPASGLVKGKTLLQDTGKVISIELSGSIFTSIYTD